tara:strand:- start:286 stop:480 length:195 start_codon:yes stop_codon:yes gene_type:complete
MSKKRVTKSGAGFIDAMKQAQDEDRLTARNLRRLASRKRWTKNNGQSTEKFKKLLGGKDEKRKS